LSQLIQGDKNERNVPTHRRSKDNVSTDWRKFQEERMSLAHDLAGFGLLLLGILAGVFVVVGVLYGLWRELLKPAHSYLVQRGFIRSSVGRGSAKQHSAGRWRHFIEIGILSVALAMVGFVKSNWSTPGSWATGKICQTSQGSSCDLRVILFLPMILDASMIFIVLWGAYSAWTASRDQGHRVE
jgi:hypothetical protein